MAKYKIFIPNNNGFNPRELIIEAERLLIESGTKKVVLLDGDNIVSVVPQGALVCIDQSREPEIEPKSEITDLSAISQRMSEMKEQFKEELIKIFNRFHSVDDKIKDMAEQMCKDSEKVAKLCSSDNLLFNQAICTDRPYRFQPFHVVQKKLYEAGFTDEEVMRITKSICS